MFACVLQIKTIVIIVAQVLERVQAVQLPIKIHFIIMKMSMVLNLLHALQGIKAKENQLVKKEQVASNLDGVSSLGTPFLLFISKTNYII